MAEFNEVYRRATYYDIVFGRDVTREIDFVIEVYRQHHNGSDPTSLLDLACGPAYHARNFAKRGFRAVGLDLRAEMLAFADDLAQQDHIHVEWLSADMRDLNLSAPVDVAINVFDGIDCLLTNDDLVAHLNTIADNLTEGGLYFIDVTHPRLTSYDYYEPFRYHGERDGISVDIRWNADHVLINPIDNIASTQVEMVVNDNGNIEAFTDMALERILTAQEIVLLSQLTGKLVPVGWYGDYELTQPFDNTPSSRLMIAVLQKRELING